MRAKALRQKFLIRNVNLKLKQVTIVYITISQVYVLVNLQSNGTAVLPLTD